jgi:hypothetical protein
MTWTRRRSGRSGCGGRSVARLDMFFFGWCLGIIAACVALAGLRSLGMDEFTATFMGGGAFGSVFVGTAWWCSSRR